MKQNNFFILLLIAGFTTILTAQVPSYIPTNGLIAYYPFTGNANDVSTNAINGTVSGATLTTDRFGNTNSAYNFYGTNDFIEVPVTSGKFDNQSYTISFWFRTNQPYSNPAGGPNVHPAIISRLNTGGPIATSPQWNDNFVIYNAGNSLNMQSSNGVVNYGFNSSSTTTSNNIWEHFTIIFDPATGHKIYKNGVLKATENLTFGNIVYKNYPLRFGRSKYTYWKDLSGEMDDVGFWNRALTQDEISNLYNANICYQSITVTDTLIINLGILGYNPVTYNNSIAIYPNPAKDHITIDCGTLSSVTGYQIKISNLLGQEVFSTTLNQQKYSISLNSWTGKGIYLVTVYDASSKLLTTRKIDLQ